MELDEIIKLLSQENKQLSETYALNTRTLMDQMKMQSEQQKTLFSQLTELLKTTQEIATGFKDQQAEYINSIQAVLELLEKQGEQTERLETVTLALVKLSQ